MSNNIECVDLLGTFINKGDTVIYSNKGSKSVITGNVEDIVYDERYGWILTLPNNQYRKSTQVCYLTTVI